MLIPSYSRLADQPHPLQCAGVLRAGGDHDKNGNINTKILGDAAKAVLKENGGFTLGKVKFGEADVCLLYTSRCV